MTISYIASKTGSYNATDGKIYTAYWSCQSFTVVHRFVVKQLTLKLARTGNPGKVTVSIRDTTAYVPGTLDECTKIFANTLIVADTTGAELTVTFDIPAILYPGRIYSIIMRTAAGDSSNFIVWCTSNANPYTGGKYGISTNSGASWNINYGGGGYDAYFDILGDFQLINLGSAFVGKQYGIQLKKSQKWNTDVVQYRTNLEQRNQAWSNPIRTWSMAFKHLTSGQRDKIEEVFGRSHGAYGDIVIIDPYDSTATCTFTQTALAITAVSQASKTFTVSGKYDTVFKEDRTFLVDGSTGNDGICTIASVSYDYVLLTTTITVTDTLPSAVVDGYIYQNEFELYKTYYPGELEQFNETKHCVQAATTVVTVNGSTQTEGVDYYIDDLVGWIVFVSGSVPANGAEVSVTYSFYYRVRFTTDDLGQVPNPPFWEYDELNVQEVKCNSEFVNLDSAIGGNPPA